MSTKKYLRGKKVLKFILYMDVKLYDKQKKAKLFHYIIRLEFYFKGVFFPKGAKLKDFDSLVPKIQKTIKWFSGL